MSFNGTTVLDSDEISTFGQSEEEVRKAGIPHECGIPQFRETSRGQIMGLKSGMMKLIFSVESRRLLGATSSAKAPRS